MTNSDQQPKPGLLKAVELMSNICGVAAAAMIVASVFITCQMIFVRGVLGVSTVWQTEAVIYLMIGATLIGLPYVQHKRGHVGVDLVPNMLGAAARRALAMFVLALSLAIILAMVFYGWEMFHLAWARNWKSESVWAFPLWIPYLTVPVGFGIFAIQLIVDLWLVAADRGDPFATTVHGVSPDGENF